MLLYTRALCRSWICTHMLVLFCLYAINRLERQVGFWERQEGLPWQAQGCSLAQQFRHSKAHYHYLADQLHRSVKTWLACLFISLNWRVWCNDDMFVWDKMIYKDSAQSLYCISVWIIVCSGITSDLHYSTCHCMFKHHSSQIWEGYTFPP